MLDNAKDQTLQEITETVRQIETEVKDRKAQLAPEIQKLRTLRASMQEVETTYNDRKRAYDNVVSQLGQEKGTLDKDVK